MRLLITIVILILTTSCDQFTTSEFSSVDVNFKDVDWYAKRAQLAYQSKDEIENALGNVLYVEVLPEKDIQFFVEQLPDKRQLVSVRGTANLANVREDVEYKKSRNDKIHIYVHDGFDEDANVVFNHVLPYLDKNQEIILTGHSLGAAVSTLLMIYLYHEGFDVGPSVNFGQPKFTNKEGATTYGFLNLVRVVNNKDLVPLLPPLSALAGVHGEYQHFGQEVILLNGPHFVYLDNHIVTEKDLSAFWVNLEDVSVKDHMIVNYRNAIQDKFQKQVEVPYDKRHKFH